MLDKQRHYWRMDAAQFFFRSLARITVPTYVRWKLKFGSLTYFAPHPPNAQLAFVQLVVVVLPIRLIFFRGGEPASRDISLQQV